MGGILGGASSFLVGDKPKYGNQPTQFETLPDWAQSGMQDVYNRTAGFSDSQFMPVPQSPAQLERLAQLQGYSQPQQNGFNFGQQANAAFGDAAQSYAGAQPYIQGGSQGIGFDQIQGGISALLNPYTQNVVDTTTRNLEEQAARQAAGIRGQTSAFGGDRQAIQESDLTRNLMQTTGDVTGGLYQSGYNTALEGAMRNLEGNRSAQQYGAGAMMGLGQGQQQLGSSLMQARLGMEDIRNAQFNRGANQIQTQLAGADALRQPAVEAQQAPFRQIAALQSSLSGVPAGGGQYGQLEAGTGGMLASNGSWGQAARNVGMAAMGMPSGMGGGMSGGGMGGWGSSGGNSLFSGYGNMPAGAPYGSTSIAGGSMPWLY